MLSHSGHPSPCHNCWLNVTHVSLNLLLRSSLFLAIGIMWCIHTSMLVSFQYTIQNILARPVYVQELAIVYMATKSSRPSVVLSWPSK